MIVLSARRYNLKLIVPASSDRAMVNTDINAENKKS